MAFNASLEILRLRKALLFHRIAIAVLAIAVPIVAAVSWSNGHSRGSYIATRDVAKEPPTDLKPVTRKYRMMPFSGNENKLELPPWELNKFNDGINPERLVAKQNGYAILGDKKLEFSPLSLLIRGNGNDIEIYFVPAFGEFNFSEKYPVEIRFSGTTEAMELPVSGGSKGSFFVPNDVVPTFLDAMNSKESFRIKYFTVDERPVVTEYFTKNIQGIVGAE